MTFGQFFTIWCRLPSVVEGIDMDAIRAKINKRRKELGMLPMKPAPKGKR